MHDHADQLEELLPYIAGESYLRTALAYELTRTDEPIRLIKLLPEAQLCELRRLSSSTPSSTSPAGADGGDGKRQMAESLSLLAREHNGQMRHDRLMTDLRQTYLLFFGMLILALLLAISLAIGFGTHANLARADTWAQLLLVLAHKDGETSCHEAGCCIKYSASGASRLSTSSPASEAYSAKGGAWGTSCKRGRRSAPARSPTWRPGSPSQTDLPGGD